MNFEQRWRMTYSNEIVRFVLVSENCLGFRHFLCRVTNTTLKAYMHTCVLTIPFVSDSMFRLTHLFLNLFLYHFKINRIILKLEKYIQCIISMIT